MEHVPTQQTIVVTEYIGRDGSRRDVAAEAVPLQLEADER